MLRKRKLLKMIGALEHKVGDQARAYEHLAEQHFKLAAQVEAMDINTCLGCGIAFSPRQEDLNQVVGLPLGSIFHGILAPPSKYCPICKPKQEEFEKLVNFTRDNPDEVREAIKRHEECCKVSTAGEVGG